jgi:hypothetical protein
MLLLPSPHTNLCHLRDFLRGETHHEIDGGDCHKQSQKRFLLSAFSLIIATRIALAWNRLSSDSSDEDFFNFLETFSIAVEFISTSAVHKLLFMSMKRTRGCFHQSSAASRTIERGDWIKDAIYGSALTYFPLRSQAPHICSLQFLVLMTNERNSNECSS